MTVRMGLSLPTGFRRISVAALAALLLALVGCAAVKEPRDLGNLVRSSSGNDALACPASSCQAKTDFTSPDYSVPPAKLEQIARAAFQAQPRTEFVSENATDRQLVFVQRTPVLRFPDTVWVQIVARGKGSSVILYSRSAYGSSDFGVNKDRIKQWLDALTTAVRDDGGR